MVVQFDFRSAQLHLGNGSLATLSHQSHLVNGSLATLANIKPVENHQFGIKNFECLVRTGCRAQCINDRQRLDQSSWSGKELLDCAGCLK